ncbi:MAG: hypothetical protein QG635_1202, partial [Bacteroidota bacterium]|nr:hypothetical protein [Bacteroidota bacterium]
MTNQPDIFNAKAMVVEDDKASRLYAVTLLKKLISNIYEAENGKEGLELFHKIKPDIVISDINMPYMSGLDMLQQIKQINPKIQVIITTALENKENLHEAIELGINQYIVKPINKESLIRSVNTIINNIRIERELKEQESYIRTLSNAVENSSSMIMLLDKEGLIEYVNPKFLEITGYQRDELIKHSPEILKNDENDLDIYHQYLSEIFNSNSWNGEFQNRKKNGEPFWVYATISPIKNDEGVITHFVKLCEDITQRKVAHDALLKTKDELEQLVRERTKELR